MLPLKTYPFYRMPPKKRSPYGSTKAASKHPLPFVEDETHHPLPWEMTKDNPIFQMGGRPACLFWRVPCFVWLEREIGNAGIGAGVQTLFSQLRGYPLCNFNTKRGRTPVPASPRIQGLSGLRQVPGLLLPEALRGGTLLGDPAEGLHPAARPEAKRRRGLSFSHSPPFFSHTLQASPSVHWPR